MSDFLKLYFRFLKYSRKWLKYGIFAGLITLFIALIQLPLPFLTKYAIDNVFPRKNLGLLTILASIFLLLLIVRAVSNHLSKLMLFHFRERTLMQLRLDLFEHVEYLNMSFHNNAKLGDIITHIGTDVDRLHGIMAETVLFSLQNALTFVIGIIALLYLQWKLALLSFVLLPSFAFTLYKFSPKIRRTTHVFHEKMSNASSLLCETFYCISVIKTFCLEQWQKIRFAGKLEDVYSANYKYVRITAISSTATMIIAGLGPLLILYQGGREVMNGSLTLGGFVAFNAFLGYLFGPIQYFTSQNVSIQTAITSLKRIFSLLDKHSEKVTSTQYVNISKFSHRIQYKNITFSYNNNAPAISDITLEINQGEKIALVGKSGCGKTTIVHLLLKLYKPQQGKIVIDGNDINKLNTRAIRKLIGIVQQNPYLIDGSIKDNILVGNMKATNKELQLAAKAADLADFVAILPLGYETTIGERGVRISGGQKQKLAIARALLKNPEILILDEATSEIDSDAEREIYRNINQQWPARTTVIIAHRLFSIRYADNIIFLEKGKVLASGRHEYLYNNLDAYRRMYDDQIKNYYPAFASSI